MRKKRHQTGKIFSFILWGLGCLCLISGGILIGRQMSANPKAESSAREKVPYEQEKITDAEVTGEFYYEQLSDEEQTVYREILQGIQENKKEIYLHCSNADTANEVFQNVLNDRPEIFWCDGNATSTEYSQSEGQSRYVVIEPNYLYEGEEKEQRNQEIESARDTCLSGISDLSDEYEKIKYIYTYLIDNVDYDLDAPDNQNIYSIFVNRQSVCAGYSKATQYLLEQLGVFCTYVTGKTTEGGNHAWNLVKCNGDYYYVDTTWGDPVFQQEEGEDISRDTNQETDTSGNKTNISYDYMCCDDTQLFQTHILDKDTQMPECSKMDCNYYVANGMYYTQYDAEQALGAMNQTIWTKKSATTFKFSDNAVYQQAHDDIFQKELAKAAQNLADYYGLSQVKYQYIDDPRLHKIVIFWQYS